MLEAAVGLAPVTWLSPLFGDEYAEYRDEGFLQILDLQLTQRPLNTFWPARGPQWDALGLGRDGRVILIEAKAHLAEIDSPPTQASGRSLTLIKRSLKETADGLGASPREDWTEKYYQYANRLAHAYLLQNLNGIPVTLAFVNFVGDASVSGPNSRSEWEDTLGDIHRALGFQGPLPDFVIECFIDVSGPQPVVV